MTVVTLEVAKIRLRPDASEADLFGASERFQREFRRGLQYHRVPAFGLRTPPRASETCQSYYDGWRLRSLPHTAYALS